MTKIMPVPRNLILLSYQQRARLLFFCFRAPYGGGGFSLLLAYGAVDKLAVLAPDVRNALPIVV